MRMREDDGAWRRQFPASGGASALLTPGDEDMTPMHTAMIGACNGVEEVQQGCPSQRGGMRLIPLESPRWRPKAIQVQVQFGVRE
jgi:hypothetical protein